MSTYSPHTRSEAARLYLDEQMSAKAIAKVLSISDSTVYAYLRPMNIDRRAPSPPSPTPEQKAEMRRLYLDDGLNLNEVSLRVGFSRSAVRKYVNPPKARRHGEPRSTTTPELLSQARRLYVDEQLPMSQVAARLDVSVPFLRKQLSTMEIEIRPRMPSGLSADDVAQMYRLYVEEGTATATIAEAMGVHISTVHSHLKAAGAPMRPGGVTPAWQSTPGLCETIRRLYVDENLSARSIGKRTDISYATVGRYLRSMGVATRPERSHPGPDPQLLSRVARLYIDERCSAPQIAVTHG